MSAPFKIIPIAPQVYSISFEDKTIDFGVLRDAFLSHGTIVSEVTFTFNRMNIFLHQTLTSEAFQKFIIKVINNPLVANKERYLWQLPICFDTIYSTDLLNYFQGDEARVVAYQDAFLNLQFRLVFYGFLPGFGYFDGLPQQMHLPRKSTPNQRTLQGTVAVGGAQLGIYPQDSPGGWQGIGHCPISLFHPHNDPPVLISPNDEVLFFKIDQKEHDQIAKAVARACYLPKSNKI